MTTLPQIIQTECIPRRNCLLSVTDVSGDTGFLYFKDAQLIEANHATVWGQQAFLLISKWQISGFSISELPMGIKRTLWEPIDKIVEETFGDSETRPAASAVSSSYDSPRHASKSETQQLAFSKIYALPGFLALFLESGGQISLVHATTPKLHPNVPWLSKISQQCHSLSKSLGTGNVRKFFLKTDDLCGWRIPIGKEVLFIFADQTADPETFDGNMKEALSPLL